MNESVQNTVIFTGDIDNPYASLKICNIYTHISLCEGLPLALLEAMVMGKPIIATPVGGIPEVVVPEETGLLVPIKPKSATDVEPVDPAKFASDFASAVNSLFVSPEKIKKKGKK